MGATLRRALHACALTVATVAGAEAATRCPAPTIDHCRSPVWAQSACGQAALAAIGERGSVCAALCAQSAPDAIDCEDPAWLSSVCGAIERPRLAAARHAAAAGVAYAGGSQCAAAIGDLSTPAGLPTAEVLLPGTVVDGAGAETSTPTGATATATQAPYGREGQVFGGMTGAYMGHRLREWTRASSAMPGDEGGVAYNGIVISPAFLDAVARASWDANGIAVASCREYVYEKYQDYSVFEDAVMSLGDDWRAVYEVAYAGSDAIADALDDEIGAWVVGLDPGGGIGIGATSLAPPASAIGTYGLLGAPQTARDGTLIDPQIRFPSGSQPKNAFFSGPLLDAAERAQAIAEAAVFEELPGTCGFSMRGPVLCDEALFERLTDGLEHDFVESWAWHRHKAEVLEDAGYSDEELAALRQVGEAFEALLYRRQVAIDEIIAFWKRQTDPIEANLPIELEVLFDPSIFELPAMGGPVQQMMVMQGQHEQRRLDRHTIAYVKMGRGAGEGGRAGSGDGTRTSAPALLWPTRTVSAPPSRILGRLAARETQSLVDQYRALQMRVMRIDAEIEAKLHDALALGCLDLVDDNPCDWSPKHFAQRVLDLYGPQREADYTACLDETPEGFARLVGHDLGINRDGERLYPAVRIGGDPAAVACFVGSDGGVGDPVAGCDGCNDWTQGTARVDRYFACAAAWKQLALSIVDEDIGDVMGADGVIRMAGSAGESTRVGNDQFNVELSYGFGWSIGEFEGFLEPGAGDEARCHLKPEGYGHFDLTATALFLKQNIIHASAHARIGEPQDALALPGSVTENTIEVQVLDQDIFDPIETVVDNTFAVVRDAWGEGGDIFSAQATFTIVFVPVTVRGGVAGKIGVAYAVGGEVPLDPQSGECDLIRYGGEFGPFAQVDGFASVSIDAVVAEAGIKITLTVIRIDLPFGVSVAIGIDPETAELILDIESRLDLVVSFLSGKVSAYVRLLTETLEGTLFAWDGPRFSQNLFDIDVELPLLPLKEAFNAFRDVN